MSIYIHIFLSQVIDHRIVNSADHYCWFNAPYWLIQAVMIYPGWGDILEPGALPNSSPTLIFDLLQSDCFTRICIATVGNVGVGLWSFWKMPRRKVWCFSATTLKACPYNMLEQAQLVMVFHDQFGPSEVVEVNGRRVLNNISVCFEKGETWSTSS